MLVPIALACLLCGLAAGFAVGLWSGRRQQAQAGTQLRDTFSALAAEALQTSNAQFLQLAQEKLSQHQQAGTQELEGKQALITQTLTTLQQNIGGQLEKVTTMVTEIDKNRHASFTTLSQRLEQTGEQLKTLQTTTADLKSALANSRTRGQWGERMAEDVLRNAGFQLGVNYRRQSTLEGNESGARGRPDYSFPLPGNRVIHMDVKFPLDNYLVYLNAEAEPARAAAAKQFVADARNRLRETTARDYRTVPTAQGEQSIDYLLIFIPNEQVYAFLIEQAPSLLDEARAQKLILCSPTTLLAVLAVISQTAEHFRLQQQAGGIQGILADIRREWDKFGTEMEKIGKKLREAQTAFDDVTGTRTRVLDRQFTKLDSLDVEGQPTLLASTKPELPIQ